ncbi:MAG: hypothetical protein A3E82_03890 [Gammaproteobacteria bacterium RIFCSPHIGHO2_12_FULL_38_11]|nr:MAG: hypothetical protein A3E82_03890 [Gammaproteobacteria bacterium RIFCSPHIGHO2_12_FULL_38_11]
MRLKTDSQEIKNNFNVLRLWWEGRDKRWSEQNSESHSSDSFLQELQYVGDLSNNIQDFYNIIKERAAFSTKETGLIDQCKILCDKLKVFFEQAERDNQKFRGLLHDDGAPEAGTLLVSGLLPTTKQIRNRRLLSAAIFCVTAAVIAVTACMTAIILFTPGISIEYPFIFFPLVLQAVPAFWGLTDMPVHNFTMFVQEMDMAFTVPIPMASMIGTSLYSVLAGLFAAYKLVSSQALLDSKIEAGSRKIFVSAAVFLACKMDLQLKTMQVLDHADMLYLQAVIKGAIQSLQASLSSYTHETQKTRCEKASNALELVACKLEKMTMHGSAPLTSDNLNLISEKDRVVFDAVIASPCSFGVGSLFNSSTKTPRSDASLKTVVGIQYQAV